MFHAAFFEALGRRVAAAPRAVAAALLALCAVASPGVVRLDLATPAPAPEGDTLLGELTCDAGVWAAECVAQVDSLSRALLASGDLVESVESLTTRRRVVLDGRQLSLVPLVPERAIAALDLRRLQARAESDPAAVRGLVAANGRAALVQARLRAGAAARDVGALARALRSRFDRPPAFALGIASDAVAADALARQAQRGAPHAVLAILSGLALLAALAARSARIGLLFAALAGLALLTGAGVFALARLPLGAGAALLPALAGSALAATGFALLHRARVEERAGAERGIAFGRALGATGPAVCVSALAGATGLAVLACAAEPARGLALAFALLLLAAAPTGLVALPALVLADRRAQPPLRASALGIASEGALAQLDLAARTRSPRRALGWLALGLAVLAAGSGVRALRADPSERTLLGGTRGAADAARLARDFGGAALLRVELDSGVAGGALEPLFLERALEFEAACAREAGVGFARSLLDVAVLPAMRAEHGDDPVFAVVPPTRGQVEEALAPFGREVDTERRHLAVDLLADLRAPEDGGRLALALERHALASFGRPGVLRVPAALSARGSAARRLRRGALWGAIAAIAAVGAIAALALDSPLAGALACAPAAFASLAVLGVAGELGFALDPCASALPALVAGAAAAPAVTYLGRVRELCAAGAELGVAVSIALRDAGRPIFESAVASLACLALLASSAPALHAWSALACVGSAAGTATVLGLLPAWVRALRPGFAAAPGASIGHETHSGVRRSGR